DAALLAGVPEDILCFSRSFEDLTCFWDEEAAASGMCHFYYCGVPTACAVSMWHHGTNGTRHVCVFPSQDVRLFIQLHLRVLDAATNQTKYWRDLSVDAVGLIAPPANITARWAGAAGQLYVSWQPPLADYLNFFLYEVQCCPASSTEIPCSTTSDPSGQHPGDPSIQPAISTHTPMTGAAAASPGVGQVHRGARDGQRNLRPTAAPQPGPSPAGAGPGQHLGGPPGPMARGEVPHPASHVPYHGSNTSLSPTVLTDAPQFVQATVSQGRLSLQWLPPLEALAEQLDYQIRYAVENSHDWKVLQVPQAARKEVVDLRPGARYHAQVRAQPSGPWYQGSWSAWSKPVIVDAMADAGKGWGRTEGCHHRNNTAKGRSLRSQHPSSNAGWIIPSITVVPLLFTGVLLGLRCTFPSLYSNMKQKLWPPVPDLHRALGSFLHESAKHSQANAFYKQPPEEAVLPCLLEVLPGPRGGAAAPPPLEPVAGRLPSTDIANQSYLLMSGWEPR
ncbi:TPOR protein, partial [Columbina picui]|nr:TPOR protein [Columbina picui]